jgi:lysozyme
MDDLGFQPDKDNDLGFVADDLGFKPEKKKTSLPEDIGIAEAGVKNTYSRYAGLLRGGLATLMGDTDEADRIYRKMEETVAERNRRANPENKEQGFGGKVVGTLATLPAQLLSMPFTPATSGVEALNHGENIDRASAIAAANIAGNMAAIGLPGMVGRTIPGKIISGAAINTAQDVGTRLAQSNYAQTPEGRKAFEPTTEDAAIAALLGGGIGGAHGAYGKIVGRKAAIQQKAILDKLDQATEREQAKNPSIDEKLAQLQDQELVSRLKDIDEKLGFQEDLSQAHDKSIQNRLETIHEALGKEEDPAVRERLNAMLDDEIRQRLEQADKEAELSNRSPQLDQNTGELFNGVKRAAPVSEEPMFVDPQGQVFRGDPADPNARIALENEGNAYSDALETRAPGFQEGEVLPGLQDHPLMDQLNDMQKQTESLLEKFKNGGISSGGKIGRQRGAVDLGIGESFAKWFTKRSPFGQGGLSPMQKDRLGRAIVPDPDPDFVLEAARKQRDSGSGLTGPAKNFESGSILAKYKRGSAAVAGVGAWVTGAFKRAEVNIIRNVFPVETSLKHVSLPEMVTLQKVFEKEFRRGDRRFSDETLREAGLSDTQLKAYKDFRAMMEDTLARQNDARKARGQAPIKELEGYFSSKWQGDFRRPVFDAEGRLKWVLAADTKYGLNKQTDALLKQFPDLKVMPKKDFVNKDVGRRTDVESAYTIMLDVLGRDDPAVQKIKEWKEQLEESAVGQYLGQEKHFENKAGIRGYVGDRPGRSPEKEALAFFQNQIQYAKNAYRWSEMQEAGLKVKKILNDPELRDTQPNNLDYIRDYWKHAIGASEWKWIRDLNDLLKENKVFPMSLRPVSNALSMAKSYFIISKLAVNTGYTVANGISTALAIPHFVDLMTKGYIGDPISAISVGLSVGPYMAARHTGKAWFDKTIPELPGQDFLNRAMQYAEDNGITARSIYDESPISNQFTVRGKVGHMAGQTMTVPETFFRSTVFMTFVQYLKSTGKFKDEGALFKMAEDRTNASMADYAATEKPMIFQKLGALGNFFSTLQTFGMNYYNQMGYFAREAGRGNPLPFMTFLGVQMGIAGVMGVPYAEDMYKLWMAIKDNWLPPDTWAKAQKNEFLSDPKLWTMQHAGTWATYGAVADNFGEYGMGLTTRIAAPSAGQMLQTPAGPVLDLIKQIGAVSHAAMNPNDTTALAQAAMTVAPVGLQGALETSPMMEGKTFEIRQTDKGLEKVYQRSSNMEAHSGEYTRTNREEQLRRFGLRDQEEVLQRDIAYSTNRASKALDEKAKEIEQKLYDAVTRGDTDAIQKWEGLYVELTGNDPSDSIENRAVRSHMTGAERAETAEGAVQKLLQGVRSKEILDEYRDRKAKEASLKTSDAGLQHIMEAEGVRTVAYKDSKGIPTIGVGHTGPDVHLGMKASTEQIKAWLVNDVKTAEDAVNKLVKVLLTQNQYDALVSFVFNVGSGAFEKSTLLKRLNSGDIQGAAGEFPRWSLADGKVLRGLMNRRLIEQELFLNGDENDEEGPTEV